MPSITDIEHARQQDAKSSVRRDRGWRTRIRQFRWNWFASTMSTGAIAMVLAQTPYQFTGLQTIGKIFFMLDVAMFLSFCILMATRFIMGPKAIAKSLHHPPEALFFGSFWVSVALILDCTQAYGVSASRPWLLSALRICFWTYVALVIVVAVSQYATIFIAEQLPLSSAMPAWILPMYPFLVLGPLAATLAPSQSSDDAIQMILAGITFQGLGWIMSTFVYAIYILRLMSGQVPAPSTRPGMFISVGPAGYTGAAFVALGVQAQQLLPPDEFGTVLPVGDVLRILGVTAGIFLWLLTFWFFAVTMVGIVGGLQEMEFSLTWWAFVFPNGGFTLCTIQIGKALDSHAIKVLASIMTALLVMAWLVIAVLCVKAVAQKRVLWPGKDDDEEEAGDP